LGMGLGRWMGMLGMWLGMGLRLESLLVLAAVLLQPMVGR
jgi:hypothetical protein